MNSNLSDFKASVIFLLYHNTFHILPNIDNGSQKIRAILIFSFSIRELVRLQMQLQSLRLFFLPFLLLSSFLPYFLPTANQHLGVCCAKYCARMDRLFFLDGTHLDLKMIHKIQKQSMCTIGSFIIHCSLVQRLDYLNQTFKF